jgi:glycosyltransferase involved in cell wall biosynthesis
MKFSLIIATLGRKNELRDMLISLKLQNYDLSEIEIIIVDQNQQGFLDEIINEFKNLNIKYIHSTTKGLSLNRNIGLSKATGNIICFPDDDCKFYDNTLIEVENILSDTNIDFCLGRIYDRKEHKDIIKKWSKKEFKINKFNSYFINNSITLFIKKESILFFDENLGIGAKYGSCEDADLIYRILENRAKGVYAPKIELWHPEPNYQVISLEKVKSYTSGFGYFIRKKTDFIKITLLMLLIVKKFLQLFVDIFQKRMQKKYFSYYFYGLINGLKGKDND